MRRDSERGHQHLASQLHPGSKLDTGGDRDPERGTETQREGEARMGGQGPRARGTLVQYGRDEDSETEEEIDPKWGRQRPTEGSGSLETWGHRRKGRQRPGERDRH